MLLSKIRALMRSIFAHLLGVWLVLGGGASFAEKADRNKPMNIESDALRYDDLKQVSVFTGNVVLTKGTILIRGARIEVRQDPEGFQFGLVTSEPGQLAFFRQKREGVDEYIEGEGENIEYNGRADTVKFVKRAQMRRLRGATLADEVSGDVIQYENATDVFTVDGSPARPSVSRGRVRVVLTPKPNNSAAVPLRPQPELQPSNSLGGNAR